MTSRFAPVIALLCVLSACSSNHPSPPPAATWSFAELTLAGTPSAITAIAFVPGTFELLVLLLTGEVQHHQVDPEAMSTSLLGSFAIEASHISSDCGLISVAFDPGFAENGFVFLGHCVDDEHSAIGRVTLPPGDRSSLDYDAVAASYVTILELGDDDATHPWHNVGSLMFDEEGAMLALFGDKTVRANAQDLSSPLGGVVRIFPSRDPEEGGYQAPDSAVYPELGASPILYAKGLRSPWMGFRDDAGRIVLGDVGEVSHEEVNVVTAPGQNFGWPLSEGPCGGSCDGLVDPVRTWNRSEMHPFVLADSDAEYPWYRVAWVTRANYPDRPDPYHGRLASSVLYGDLCVGFVRRMVLDDAGAVLEDEHLTHLANATGWDIAPDGFVYAATFAERCNTNATATYGQGRLFRLMP
jgi:glucose/arabinose dehydrogenase